MATNKPRISIIDRAPSCFRGGGRLLEACARTFDCGSQLLDLALFLGFTLHFELQLSVANSDEIGVGKEKIKQ
jgi:hypothetical protein